MNFSDAVTAAEQAISASAANLTLTASDQGIFDTAQAKADAANERRNVTV